MRRLLIPLAIIAALVAAAVWVVPSGAEIARVLLVVVCAVAVLVCVIIAARIPPRADAKMYSVEKQLMVEIKDVVVDERGLGCKAILLGAMRKTVYIRPGDLWNLLSMIKPGIVMAVLKTLLVSPANREQPTKK
ncbi:MAG: hypothetical protein LBD77_01485 [Bifidobacteriaceae bacterium]|jgi:hypothetical protein|nr:hypothetical protein [Bifidobacteriaceae bacterium]